MVNSTILKDIGIGIDIIEINRFKKIINDKKKNFYEKIFTKSEIEYCTSFKDDFRHFASQFAIKEAVIKSIDVKISFMDINISHSNSKPIIILKGKLKNQYMFFTSLSHEKKFAVAVVLSIKIKKSKKN